MTDHNSLLGLSDRDLLMRCSEATHQHFKGGLYRLLGHALDADTGEAILGKDGLPRVVYEHVYPHARQIWVRDRSEWEEVVNWEDYGSAQLRCTRFRPLRK